MATEVVPLLRTMLPIPVALMEFTALAVLLKFALPPEGRLTISPLVVEIAPAVWSIPLAPAVSDTTPFSMAPVSEIVPLRAMRLLLPAPARVPETTTFPLSEVREAKPLDVS